MTYDGRLLEVEVLGRGTSATADVAAGGTQVPVEDLTEFSDEGGRCEIAGVQYDYTGIIEAADGTDAGTDAEAGSLVLADPLTVDVAEADPVRVVVGDQAATDAWAVIDLGSPRQDVVDDGADGAEVDPEAIDGPDVGDVVRVPLSFSQRLVYLEGVYEPPVPVQVADDLSAVIDVPGVVPVIDGGMIDPDTLPTPPSGPTAPPGPTPDLTVTAGVDLFILRVANSDPEWSGVQIEYHATQAEDGVTFAPTAGDPATLIGTTNGVLVARTLADSTPFAIGTDYAFAAIARVGANVVDPSAPQVARLDPSAVEDVVAAQIVAGFILTGRIQIGQSYIDADEGFVIPQPDGTSTVIPFDGVSPATISGFLIANGMTMKDGAYFYGLSQISGRFLLNNGVPDPKQAPTVTGSLKSYPLDQLFTSGGFPMTITSDDASLIAVTRNNAGSLLFVRWPKNEAPTPVNASVFYGPVESGTSFVPTGIARVGETYYVLRVDPGGGDLILDRFARADVESAPMQSGIARAGTTNVGITIPAFGLLEFPGVGQKQPLPLTTDGTYLYLSWMNSSGEPHLGKLSTAGGLLANWTLGNPDRASFTENDIVDGICVVASESTSKILVNFRNAKQSSRKVIRGYPLSQPDGYMYWDDEMTFPGPSSDTSPASLTAGSDRIYMVGTGTTTMWMFATIGGISSAQKGISAVWGYDTTINFGYTWYDSNAADGNKETKLSPVVTRDTFNYARRWLTINAQPAPHAGVVDPTQPNRADSIRIYYRPAEAGSTPTLQATLPVGTSEYTSAYFDTAATALPPIVSTFLGGQGGAGVIESEAADSLGALISLKGDGSVGYDTGWKACSNGFTGQFRAVRFGPVVFISGSCSSTTAATDNTWQDTGVVLPVGLRPSATVSFPISTTAGFTGSFSYQLLTDGRLQRRQSVSSSLSAGISGLYFLG